MEGDGQSPFSHPPRGFGPGQGRRAPVQTGGPKGPRGPRGRLGFSKVGGPHPPGKRAPPGHRGGPHLTPPPPQVLNPRPTKKEQKGKGPRKPNGGPGGPPGPPGGFPFFPLFSHDAGGPPPRDGAPPGPKRKGPFFFPPPRGAFSPKKDKAPGKGTFFGNAPGGEPL